MYAAYGILERFAGPPDLRPVGILFKREALIQQSVNFRTGICVNNKIR